MVHECNIHMNEKYQQCSAKAFLKKRKKEKQMQTLCWLDHQFLSHAGETCDKNCTVHLWSSIIKDSTDPQHSLLTILMSGRRYRSVNTRTKRLSNSFYIHAVRLLDNTFNTTSPTPHHSYWLFTLSAVQRTERLTFCTQVF